MKELKYKILNINSKEEIPDYVRNTPFEELLEFHNFNKPFKDYENAQLAIVMCMDNRKQLNIPPKFSYILRTAGARITGSEFKLSFAIGFGGIKSVALIAHTNCGMVNLTSKRQRVIEGLIQNAGWTREIAENHFDSYAPFFEIEDETDFTAKEAKRLKEKYPQVQFIPFLYKVEDNKLYIIE